MASLHCMTLSKADMNPENFESPTDLANNLAEQKILPTQIRRIIVRTVSE
jgi:hypothetical protein